tara:strand:- start:724 stop:1377 length:654 start_codon:yes stop_codon:yes gene_type:complete
MSNAIPKFNFSDSTIKTDAELNDLSPVFEDKYFRPGTAQVRIASVVYQGAAGDDSWGKFLLTLVGAGNKSITAQVLVPFRSPLYMAKSGKNTGYPFQKFKNFMLGLGIKVSVPTLETVLTEVFTNPDKSLVGRDMSVNIGYEGNYIGYMGKDDAGIKRYNITMKDGSVLADASGKALIWPEYAGAAHHAELGNIEVSRFVNVLDYNEGTAVAADGNW